MDLLRTWKCRNCSHSNRTEVARDGTAQCAFCKETTRIQPSRSRAEETPAELSIPLRRARQ